MLFFTYCAEDNKGQETDFVVAREIARILGLTHFGILDAGVLQFDNLKLLIPPKNLLVSSRGKSSSDIEHLKHWTWYNHLPWLITPYKKLAQNAPRGRSPLHIRSNT